MTAQSASRISPPFLFSAFFIGTAGAATTSYRRVCSLTADSENYSAMMPASLRARQSLCL